MITDPVGMASGFLVVVVIGAISLKARMVDTTGFIAGLIVGWSVFIFGGWKWFVVFLTFHLVTGLSTKYKHEKKREMGVAQEKGGARAWQSVIANGGIAAFLAVIEGFTSLESFFAGFLGAVSASTADTLATEIGLLNPREPRLITDLKKRVPAGTSGGVSPLGEIAILAGAVLIGLTAWVVGIRSWSLTKTLGVAVLAGFLGSTLDSLLGASVQAAYKCSICGKITERSHHCGRPSVHVKGSKIVDNNVVNLLATMFGAGVSILISLGM